MLVRSDLVNLINEETGYFKGDIKNVLKTLENVVYANIMNDDIKIMKGLVLTKEFKKEHQGRNPRLGTSFTIPAKFVPRAKFSEDFKEHVMVHGAGEAIKMQKKLDEENGINKVEEAEVDGEAEKKEPYVKRPKMKPKGK